MKITPFKLERFFAEYEFSIKYQLSPSDCESMTVEDLLRLTGTDSSVDTGKLHLGYTESLGNPRLRQAVSGLYRTVSPDGVLIAAPEEAIFLMLHAHLEPDDHAIVMSPCYQSLSAIPESIGARVTHWPVELTDGRWDVDFNVLQDAICSETKMVIVNIPHNPTGLCFSPTQKRDLISILRPKNIMLFADEMYWQLEYGRNISHEPFCDLYENAVSLSGLSKSYGLPGLRIGWLASGSADLLSVAAGLKDYTTICSSAPSELLATVAVEHSDIVTARCKNIVRTNLEHMEQMHERTPLLDLIPGQGGSVIFPKFSDGRSTAQLSKQLIEKHNLLMLPGHLFDMPDGFFRIGLGRENFPEILSIFEEAIS